MSENPNVPKICLFGDMVRHIMLKPISSGNEESYEAYINTTGALTIMKMINNALAE